MMLELHSVMELKKKRRIELRQIISLLVAILWIAPQGFSQQDEIRNNLIEQRIEEIAGTLDEGSELDYTTLFEDLAYYYEHPLNLNSAKPEELKELYLISDPQIAALLRHIDMYGPLRNIFELQAVPGFTPELIRSLTDFITAEPVFSFKNISLKDIAKETRHDLFIRHKRVIEKQAGFENDPETGVPDFVGDPNYAYIRYTAMYRKNLRAGFTLEKDAGESIDRGPDFSSFHLMYAGNTWLKKVIVGDYQALFGQGLTLWNGLAFGKSVFVGNVKRNGIGLRPYSSVQETNFLRGGGVTVGGKYWELTGLASHKKIDGNLDPVSDTTTITDDEFVVTSLPMGGLHRTASELANKNTVTEQTLAGNLKYVRRTFTAGITCSQVQLNVDRAPYDALYQKFKSTDRNSLNIGADYQAVIRNLNVFGEVARSDNGAISMLHGAVLVPHPRLTISTVYRNYAKDYQNNKANVFGENNLTAANERGHYTGAQYNINSKWTLSAYADIVHFPWLRFRVDAPGNFKDYLAQLNYKPDKKNEIYFRYRIRHNEQNSSNTDAMITPVVPVRQENWRLHGVFQVHPNVQLKTRAEWSRYEKENTVSNGFVVYQDIIFKKIGSPVSFSMRYAIMDAPDWNSRIYAYENDVLYAFSILPYNGKGVRYYLMIKYDVTRRIDFWARYGAFVYDDRSEISSGTSLIQGQRKSDIHLQMRIRF